MKLAVVRGKFLNQYEMQSFGPLTNRYDITAFGSLTPYHGQFSFPVVKLPSPMDLPDFPYKMSILNRLFIDAHYLFNLEGSIKGFDIVHTAETYYRYTQQCLDAKKKGYVKKVVATVLENIPFNNEGIWGRKAYKKRSREELDHIIALTKLTKTALIDEGADPGKITVIGHGIDIRRFVPAKDHWSRLEKKNPKSLTICFSGRIETYKGVMDILYAIPIILSQKNIPRLKFLFIGKGSALPLMKETEKKLGIGACVSHVSVLYQDMPDIYAQADIFVAPSVSTKTWSEQYCTALLEAQSMGLPIVTTRSGGIPENVGDAAFFCEEKSPVSLAQALLAFIKSGQKRLSFGTKARKRAESTHDIHHIADLLDRVYATVLTSRSTHPDNP